jgi:hypothetical protein
MAAEEAGHVVPLYIGKTETLGKGDGNLSANIKGIDKDTSKFTRWGDNNAYPSAAPVLQRPVYFWSKAWSSGEVGVLEELGPTKLTFLEYQIIGVASSAFGESLLNREGQNR